MKLRLLALFLWPLALLFLHLSPTRAQQAEHQAGIQPSTLVLMNLSAHPDDEDGATLAYYGMLKNVKTYSIFFTRGEGGQNEIGSELYSDLGALRTKETLDAAKILGTTAYFLGFPDFGFSKTAKETFAKWGGEDSVLARLVYYIRALKPDVIITNHDTVTTPPFRQHGNHQAVGITAYEAFDKAADPSYHSEQLTDGITPWQVKKLYVRLFRQDTTALREPPVSIDVTERDREGTSMEQIALTALAQHRSQGMDKIALASIPSFFRKHRYILYRSNRTYPFDPHDVFSGIEPTSRPAVAVRGFISELPPVSFEVSPTAVPVVQSASRAGDGRPWKFGIRFVNRTSRPVKSKLSVFHAAQDVDDREYVLNPGDIDDTLSLKTAASSTDTIHFRLTAWLPGGQRTSELPVIVKPEAVIVPRNVTIGLIRTYDNTLEETLRSFGISYRLIDSSTLAAGDLDTFTAILLDLRTFEFRTDAVRYVSRLLDYARSGGNLVVFYHKTGDWNGKTFAPYPLTVTGERVTEEDAAVTELLPEHPLLNEPNHIRPHDWDGWVQERSIYLPSGDSTKTDSRYETLLAMSDEGEHQPSTSLLWTRCDRGTYTYVALVLYRQLQILNDAAVKLFLNILAQPRH